MGVCGSVKDTTKNKKDKRVSGNIGNNQDVKKSPNGLVKNNEEGIQITIPTDNNKPNRYLTNEQDEISKNNNNNIVKDSEKDKDIVNKDRNNVLDKDNEIEKNKDIEIQKEEPISAMKPIIIENINNPFLPINKKEDNPSIINNADKNKTINNQDIIIQKNSKNNDIIYDNYLYSFIDLNIGSCNDYSSETDWTQILKQTKRINNTQLSNKLLSLNERNWNKENLMLSELIKTNREQMESYILNKYLNNRIKLQEHYNWLIWALSLYYQTSFLNKSTETIYNDNTIGLPHAESTEWLIGFEWKGVYIKIINEEHSHKLKAEVKALNLLFFDYIQILDTIHPTDEAKYLSNDLLFPLISYGCFNGVYLMVSVCISKLSNDLNESIENTNRLGVFNGNTHVKNPLLKETLLLNSGNNVNRINSSHINAFVRGKSKDSISHIANEDGSVHSLNDSKLNINNNPYDINLSQFKLDDLQQSNLFRNLKPFNLLKIIDISSLTNVIPKEKYLLISVIDLIPNIYSSNEKSASIIIEENKSIKYENTKEKTETDIIKSYLSEPKMKYEMKMYGIEYQVYANEYNVNNVNIMNTVINNLFIRNHINQIGDLGNRVIPSSLNKMIWLQKVLMQTKHISISNQAVVLYSLLKNIKVKYPLIIANDPSNNGINPNGILYDDHYARRSHFINHIESLGKMLNDQKGITDPINLRHFFKRNGINKCFNIFILPHITNGHIGDIIKIDLLTSLLSHCLNFEEGVTLNTKVSLINFEFGEKNYNEIITTSNSPSIQERNIASIRIAKIYYLIMSILNISQVKDYAKQVLEQVSFSLFMKSLQWRLIDEELGFNLFTSTNYNDPISVYHNFSPLKMLNDLINTARNKPFVFLGEIERKLCFTIDPKKKLTASISLDNFINEFNRYDIRQNDPIVKSYIVPLEITYYLLAKSIQSTNKALKYENEKEQIQFNQGRELMISNSHLPSVNQSRRNDHENNDEEDDESDKPNMTIDKFSRNYVCKMKPNNITKINNRNNKYIASVGIGNTVGNNGPSGNNPSNNFNQELDIDTRSIVTDFRLNKKANRTVDKVTNHQLRLKYWEMISSIFEPTVPPILYKLLYHPYTNNQVDNCSMQYKQSQFSSSSIYKFLDTSFRIKRIETVRDWKTNADIVLNDIYMVNKGENSMMHIYLYLFLHYFYIAMDLVNAKEIFNKMKENIQHCHSYSLNWMIIMNYMEGLMTESKGYIESEEFYSKTIIFSLFLFGDPRGRNCNGHFISLFPMWKVGRQACILDNTLSNETLKELFYSQDHCFKLLLSPIKSFKVNPSYISSLKYISMLPAKILPKQQVSMKFSLIKKNNTKTSNKDNNEEDDLYCNCDNDLLERPSLVPQIGNDELEKQYQYIISDKNFESYRSLGMEYFLFPSISDTKCSYISHFFSETFFAFLLKSLSSIIFNDVYNNSPFTEEYLTQIGLNCYSINHSLPTHLLASPSNNLNQSVKSSLKKSKGNNILSSFLYDYLLKKLDYKKSPPNGTIITWGNNTHNETSHNNYDYLFLPRMVFKLKDQEVMKITAGWEHSIVITKERRCFSWGHNHYGQCGLGEGQTILNPSLIKELTNIKDVSCGNEHSLAINMDGDLYSWGNSEDGVLGFKGKAIEYYPVKLTSNTLKKVIQISCGTIHNLALDNGGRVYSWGCTKGGQLGLNENYLLNQKDFNGYISYPTLVEDEIKNKNIVSVSSGEAHSAVLTDEGKVYTWGFGSNGQLGLGFCEDSFEPGQGLAKSRRLTPVLLPIEEKIIHVQCGKTFTMILTNKRELYACGVNDLNQLGLSEDPPMTHLHNQIDMYNSKCSDYVSPTKLEIFINMQVLRIACGESHCLAIVNDLSNQLKTLWSWGSNRFGQLGQGSHNKKSTPRPINYFLDYTQSEISDIACGGFHSICLLKRKDLSSAEEDSKCFKKILETIIKMWR